MNDPADDRDNVVPMVQARPNGNGSGGPPFGERLARIETQMEREGEHGDKDGHREAAGLDSGGRHRNVRGCSFDRIPRPSWMSLAIGSAPVSLGDNTE